MEKRKRVATVDETRAIDYTPIYYIRPTKTMRVGQTYRFDSAEKEITDV